MRPGVDFAELDDGDVGVDLRGVEPGVSEKLLDVADVRAVLQHVGGARVAQHVARTFPPDAGGVDGAADPVAQEAGADAFSITGKEKGAATLRRIEQGPGFLDVEAQPAQGALARRHHAILAALPFSDREQAALAVEVVEIEPRAFGAPDAGGVEGLEDGAVADAQRIGDVGHVQHGVDFIE